MYGATPPESIYAQSLPDLRQETKRRLGGRSAAVALAGALAVAAFVSLTGRPRPSAKYLAALTTDDDWVPSTPLCYETTNHLAPTVFVIGCQKCGTTSLWEMATNHIYGLTTGTYKEHHFFHVGDKRYTTGGMKDYAADFPTCDDFGAPTLMHDTMKGDNHTGNILGADFDPQMAYSDVPGQIYDTYVDAFHSWTVKKLRFVSILRDPVNRTLSYFKHALSEGWLDVEGCDDCCSGWWKEDSCSGCTGGYDETCCTERLSYTERMATCNTTFDHWVDSQLDRAKSCLAKGTTLWPDCGEEGLFGGLYVYQIENFLKKFDTSQFMVIPMKHYLNNAPGSVADMATFIGGEFDGETFEAKESNTASEQGRSYSPMSAETEAKLVEFFEPYNNLLYWTLKSLDIRVAGGSTSNFL